MNHDPQYEYNDAEPSWGNQYLWPPLQQLLTKHLEPGAKVFELGCGNGAIAGQMASQGYQVVAVDPSLSLLAPPKVSHIADGVSFRSLWGESSGLAAIPQYWG